MSIISQIYQPAGDPILAAAQSTAWPGARRAPLRGRPHGRGCRGDSRCGDSGCVCAGSAGRGGAQVLPGGQAEAGQAPWMPKWMGLRWERFGKILEDGNEDFGRFLFGDMEYQKRMELQKIGKWRGYCNLIK